jgi:hypothetical protein
MGVRVAEFRAVKPQPITQDENNFDCLLERRAKSLMKDLTLRGIE